MLQLETTDAPNGMVLVVLWAHSVSCTGLCRFTPSLRALGERKAISCWRLPLSVVGLVLPSHSVALQLETTDAPDGMYGIGCIANGTVSGLGMSMDWYNHCQVNQVPILPIHQEWGPVCPLSRAT